jgi:hypothetical protein
LVLIVTACKTCWAVIYGHACRCKFDGVCN